MTYYYFGASLPTLSQDATPLLSPGQFKDLCSQHLSRRDLSALAELDQPPEQPAVNSFVSRWHNAEVSIRNYRGRSR